VVVNNLFVGLREFKQLIQAGPSTGAGDLISQRLLHGTEGIDLAETVASLEGQPTSAPDDEPRGSPGAPVDLPPS
jgi:hypothetical protein